MVGNSYSATQADGLTEDVGKPRHRAKTPSTGCELHSVTADAVAEYRTQAAERFGKHIGVCACCLGPSAMRSIKVPDGKPMQWIAMPYCGLCDGGMAYVDQVALAVGAGFEIAGAYADSDGNTTRVAGSWEPF